MKLNKTKPILIIIVLALSTLACTIYDIAGILGEDGCDIIGGVWYYGTTAEDYCGPPEKDQQVNSQPGEDKQDEDGADTADIQPSDRIDALFECDGSSIVTITVGDPETTKQGHCRYLIHYKSRSASKDVYLYSFDTHTNTKTGKNQEWYRETALFAGNKYSEYQTIFASGEISVTERVAIVFTTGVCDWVGTDHEALDEIAQELTNPCR